MLESSTPLSLCLLFSCEHHGSTHPAGNVSACDFLIFLGHACRAYAVCGATPLTSSTKWAPCWAAAWQSRPERCCKASLTTSQPQETPTKLWWCCLMMMAAQDTVSCSATTWELVQGPPDSLAPGLLLCSVIRHPSGSRLWKVRKAHGIRVCRQLFVTLKGHVPTAHSWPPQLAPAAKHCMPSQAAACQRLSPTLLRGSCLFVSAAAERLLLRDTM